MSLTSWNTKELSYYKAAAMRTRPQYVPSRIVLLKTVRPDGPLVRGTIAKAGTKHDCESNKWGAISIRIGEKMLGVKLDEFEPLEWQENTK